MSELREQLRSVQPQEKFSAYLRDSLNELKRQADSHAITARTNSATIPTNERYQQSIQKWINSITPVQRARSLTMDEVIKLSGIRGANGKPASVQAMGDALHACGFKPKRDWTAAGRNKRYWHFDGVEK